MRAGQSAQSDPSQLTTLQAVWLCTLLTSFSLECSTCNSFQFNCMVYIILYIAETYKVQSGTKLFMDVAKNEN